MIIKPAKGKIIKIYSIFFLIALVVFYFLPGFPLWPPRVPHYIILGVWVLVSAGSLFYALKFNYYEVDKTRIVHFKGRKRLIYDFNSILYIDEAWSRKKKTLLFYTNKGHARYLTLDKNGELLALTLKRCKNLISQEEYQIRFPKTKM